LPRPRLASASHPVGPTQSPAKYTPGGRDTGRLVKQLEAMGHKVTLEPAA